MFFLDENGQKYMLHPYNSVAKEIAIFPCVSFTISEIPGTLVALLKEQNIKRAIKYSIT